MKRFLTFISLALCSLTTFANDYTDKLTVTVNGESMEQQATITITQGADGKYTLLLKNFCLETVEEDGSVTRMGVGNIELTDREGTVENGITSISYNGDIVITEGDDPSVDFWMGPMLAELGPVPIEMQARFNDTQLYCEIHINLMDMLGQIIDVVFGTEPEPVVEEEVLTDPVITLKDGVVNTIHIAVGTTSSNTQTATTYYTTNGSVPSATNGTAITEDTDVTLTKSCTVKAISISTSGLESKVASYNFAYTENETVSAPDIELNKNKENTVTIYPGSTNSYVETATTYYTIDGSWPDENNGTAITEVTDVTLTQDCTVRAITISTSGMTSATAVYRFTYVEPEVVSAPTIALKEGMDNVVTISVGKSSREAETVTTYYTIDGSEPSATNGTAITADTDVELSEDCTVKAITISTSGMQSEVVSFDFTYIAPEIPEELTAPVITKKEGVKNTVTISVGKTSRETETATTYYTTNGSEPSATNGTAITADTDVELLEDCTVKAVTISTSGMQSEVVSYDFTYEVESGIKMPTSLKGRDIQAIYDLQGRKIDNRKSVNRKSLYIVNGKKVVIR
ncbi:MAG: chitobiase/beta-hexosaminidase C-terminal domain-containing protein [Prevotella sp.]|nr:chitobiase/beta-hexosaminidase C-terminal domain-containing protein [Prevotella sp.]